MERSELIEALKEKGLKVTPQRIAIFEAIFKLNNHPSAENIIAHLREDNPHIAVGTVYKVLDSLVKNELLEKVKTESGTVRYDPLLSKHHHLYCVDTDEIQDFEDAELDNLVNEYFKKKKIKNFQILAIKLQLTGTFTKSK